MKKRLAKIILLCAAALLVLIPLSVPFVNNWHAARAERRLLSLPLPGDAEVVDSLSSAGKLTGSGNGMQYFAAMLLRTSSEPEEIEAHYAALRQSPWEFLTAEQIGTAIQGIDRGGLQFDFTPQSGARYYIIYTWADSLAFFSEADLRGH